MLPHVLLSLFGEALEAVESRMKKKLSARVVREYSEILQEAISRFKKKAGIYIYLNQQKLPGILLFQGDQGIQRPNGLRVWI
jgi:hypothetical protein